MAIRLRMTLLTDMLLIGLLLRLDPRYFVQYARIRSHAGCHSLLLLHLHLHMGIGLHRSVRHTV